MRELTLVMSGSNDNYGGEVYREIETTPTSPFKDRCERCIYTIGESFKDIDYEVVYVVWNEDPNRESLLEWDFLRHPRIRLIVVPPEVAQTVEPDRQFHETWAKNVGIRRAKSEMILCTNPDVLWLDPFPREVLNIDSVMIAMRWTLNRSIMDLALDMEVMRHYRENPATRRNPDWNSNGDFTMMPRSLWFQLQGLSTPRQDSIAGIDMTQVVRAREATGKMYHYPNNIAHIEHPGKPLASSYMQIIVQSDWGFPEHKFDEYCLGEKV
jgi:hypothetical protein